jgi:hypothetical protein
LEGTSKKEEELGVLLFLKGIHLWETTGWAVEPFFLLNVWIFRGGIALLYIGSKGSDLPVVVRVLIIYDESKSAVYDYVSLDRS